MAAEPNHEPAQGIQAGRDAYVARRDLNIHNYYAAAADEEAASRPLRVGDVPQKPPGFRPRARLLAALDAAGPGVLVVQAVTGMRGVGKTQLAAAYARGKLAEAWRLVAWINAEDPATIASGLAAVAEAVGLADQGGGDMGQVVRHGSRLTETAAWSCSTTRPTPMRCSRTCRP